MRTNEDFHLSILSFFPIRAIGISRVLGPTSLIATIFVIRKLLGQINLFSRSISKGESWPKTSAGFWIN